MSSHQKVFLQCSHPLCSDCFAKMRDQHRIIICPVCRHSPVLRARVLVWLEAEQHILLVQDFTHRWLLPGGGIAEKDVTPVVAAQRELWEETGLYAHTADMELIETTNAQAYFSWRLKNHPLRSNWDTIQSHFENRFDMREIKGFWVGDWRFAAQWTELDDTTRVVIQTCAAKNHWF